MEIGFEFLNEIVSLTVSPEVCMVITGKISEDLPVDGTSIGSGIEAISKPRTIHACKTCIDGGFNLRAGASLKGKIKPLNLTVSRSLLFVTYPLDLFYFSLNNESESPLGGSPSFGFGKCPNRKYLTKFEVQNSNGQDVTDATLTVTKGSQQIPNAAPGKALYLYNGDYTATASASGFQESNKNFTVNGKEQKVTVELGKNDDEPNNPTPPSGKLATPANLTWGKNWYGNSMSGSIYWEQTDGIASYHVQVYDENNTIVHSRNLKFADHVAQQKHFHLGLQLPFEQLGSGTYYFTIQALSASDSIADSDVATSYKWTYTVPEKALTKPNPPKMDGITLSFNMPPEENFVGTVLVEGLYSKALDTPQENWGKLGPTIFGYKNWPLIEEKYEINLQEFLNNHLTDAEGYYSFHIRIIPNDINQYQISEWSEWSEPYHYVP